MGRPKYVFDLLMKFWPLSKMANRIGSRPLIGSLVKPLFSSTENESIIIPIRETLHAETSVVLPALLLKPLVERADACVALHRCICRQAEGCSEFPRDLGCLFLGRGATKIHPSLGRRMSKEEALAHSQKAVDMGLVPLVVHAAFDAFVLGIPYRSMLAVCFCCDCCCSIRHGLRIGPQAFWDTVVRLPGLVVEVGENCISCGLCTQACHIQAIRVQYGQARVSEACKGCGRCAEVCPVGAITLRIEDGSDFQEDFLRRIERRTDIGEIDGRHR